MAEQFTKTDAAALWHAVQAFDMQVREMAKMEPAFSPPVLEQEQQRAAAARRALRKVQAMRRDSRRGVAPTAGIGVDVSPMGDEIVQVSRQDGEGRSLNALAENGKPPSTSSEQPPQGTSDAVRDIDTVLAALVDIKPMAAYGEVGTYDTVQARRQTALAAAEQALLTLRRRLSGADGAQESKDPSDLLPAALDDLRRAVAFQDQVREAAKNGEEVTGTGIARDAREWIDRAAREVVKAAAGMNPSDGGRR